MKILFVCCYANNSHYIEFSKKSLDKYLLDCSYDYICLNDAPHIDSGDEDYLNICDILTEDKNCYDRIYKNTKINDFIHIKIPQSIHTKNRKNHSSARHIENFNWFNKNIDSIFPLYKKYDYLCYIDSDAFFCDYIDLNKELNSCDLAGPFIYIRDGFYIHTGLFFINLNNVHNFKDINWNNTLNTDTGSDIYNFIKQNPQYNILKLGHYDGISKNHWRANNHTILSLKIDINNERYKLIDSWFGGKVIHFRAGSCFGVGSLEHRNKDRLYLYNKKWNVFYKLLNIF